MDKDEYLLRLRADQNDRAKEAMFEGWVETPTKDEAIDYVIMEYLDNPYETAFGTPDAAIWYDDAYEVLSAVFDEARESGWKFNTEMNE